MAAARSAGSSVSLDGLQEFEGSRILTFDRKQYSFGPLAVFAARERVIGFNDGFEKLFHVPGSVKHQHKTCKDIVQPAGQEHQKRLNEVHKAMEPMDKGSPSVCFSVPNQTMDNKMPLEIAVVVLPLRFESFGVECHFMVGFQSVEKDPQAFFTRIRTLYEEKDGAAHDLLVKWAQSELACFLQMHPLFNTLSSVISQVKHSGPQPSSQSQSSGTGSLSSQMSGHGDLQASLGMTNQAMAAFDEDGTLRACNNAFAASVGCSRGQMVNGNIHTAVNFSPKLDTNISFRGGPRMNSLWQGHSSEDTPQDPEKGCMAENVTMELACQNGTKKLVGGRVWDKGVLPGLPGLAFVSFGDGSLLRKTFTSAVDAVGSAAVQLALDGNICHPNSMWLSFTTYKLEEVVGKHVDLIIHPQEQEKHQVWLEEVTNVIWNEAQVGAQADEICFSQYKTLPGKVVCVRKDRTMVHVQYAVCLAYSQGLPMGVIEKLGEVFPVPTALLEKFQTLG